MAFPEEAIHKSSNPKQCIPSTRLRSCCLGFGISVYLLEELLFCRVSMTSFIEIQLASAANTVNKSVLDLSRVEA